MTRSSNVVFGLVKVVKGIAFELFARKRRRRWNLLATHVVFILLRLALVLACAVGISVGCHLVFGLTLLVLRIGDVVVKGLV